MSSYDHTTTTDEILDGQDLTGRRIVITGASSGLGEASARALVAHGAAVTMLARNPDKARACEARIRAAVPDADLELGSVDLADLASISSFATAYLEDHPAIDVLINNAGVMCCPWATTADGFEMQFGTNHLGHFALSGLLLPALLAGDRPRLVNLSSAGHSISDVDLDDPNFATTPYDPWIAYGRSKTANVLFTTELVRRYGDRGLLSFAVHPGMIMTELGRHLTEELVAEMMQRVRARQEADGGSAGDGDDGGGGGFKSVEAGAATQVWAATAHELVDHNGAYLADCQLGVEGGAVGGVGYASYATDPQTAAALWDLSEQLIGRSFET